MPRRPRRTTVLVRCIACGHEQDMPRELFDGRNVAKIDLMCARHDWQGGSFYPLLYYDGKGRRLMPPPSRVLAL